MNVLGRSSPGTHPPERTMVHEVRLAAAAVNRALRVEGLAGPADAYHVIGSLSLMVRTEQRSFDALAGWLLDEEGRRRLTVVDGPFFDDPEAAVRVAVQSLVQASRACREVYDALERAHIAMAHVGAEQGPSRGYARRSLWRLLTRDERGRLSRRRSHQGFA